jgi:hypothetical protein
VINLARVAGRCKQSSENFQRYFELPKHLLPLPSQGPSWPQKPWQHWQDQKAAKPGLLPILLISPSPANEGLPPSLSQDPDHRARTTLLGREVGFVRFWIRIAQCASV